MSSESQKDFLEVPVLDNSPIAQSTTDSDEVFLENSAHELQFNSAPLDSSENVGLDSTKSVFEESELLVDAQVQADFVGMPQGDLKSNALAPDTNLFIEASSQCNILEFSKPSGDMIVQFDNDGFEICTFKKVVESKEAEVQIDADDDSWTIISEESLPEERTRLDSHSKGMLRCNGVDSAVQCNIIEILTCEQEILEIFNERKSLVFKKVSRSIETGVQTDLQGYQYVDDDGPLICDVGLKNDLICNNIAVDDHVMSDLGVVSDDVMANITKDDVKEKHDGEVSEKSLLKLGWKDFVDGADLGEDAKLLDCVVYEKEDVFIVICEFDRKYCKEISSNDYTFDSDDDVSDVTEEQFKHAWKEILSDNADDELCTASETISQEKTVRSIVDSNMAVESGYSESFHTVKLSRTNNFLEPNDVQVSSGVIDKISCENDVAYENLNFGAKTNVENTCPRCLRLVNVSPGIDTAAISNISEDRSFSGGVDGMEPRFNRDDEVKATDNDVDFIGETQPESNGFSFREMSDVAVQCNLYDVINFSQKDILLCGNSKPSSSDVAIQCEVTVALASNSNDDLITSSGDVQTFLPGEPKTPCTDTEYEPRSHQSNAPCLKCDQLKTSSVDASIQYEVTENVSSDVYNILCPNCGRSDISSVDIGIQYESTGIESSDVDNLACLGCVKCKTSSAEIGIQCEFTDLLSSSSDLIGDISGISAVYGEENGESLIKEVMALAKECSQNDALIDQHLSEVVLGQDLFSQIQGGENHADDFNGDDDGHVQSYNYCDGIDDVDDDVIDRYNDIGSVPRDPKRGENQTLLNYEKSRDLYSEIPNSSMSRQIAFAENEQTFHGDFSSNYEGYPDVGLTSEDATPNLSWKEFRDAETQCEENEMLKKEEKAVQCLLLNMPQHVGVNPHGNEVSLIMVYSGLCNAFSIACALCSCPHNQ